jgi:hypothetical protein
LTRKKLLIGSCYLAVGKEDRLGFSSKV